MSKEKQRNVDEGHFAKKCNQKGHFAKKCPKKSKKSMKMIKHIEMALPQDQDNIESLFSK